MSFFLKHFIELADRRLLDQKFRPTLVEHYRKLVYVDPEHLSENKPLKRAMAEFTGPISEQDHHFVEHDQKVDLSKFLNFHAVVTAMAKWFATIELCEDFICRLSTYGLIHYID